MPRVMSSRILRIWGRVLSLPAWVSGHPTNGQPTLEPVQSTLPDNVHLALLLGVAQICRGQVLGILLTALLREDKVDHGKQVRLLEVRNEMGPDVLVELESTAAASATAESTTATASGHCGCWGALAAAAVRVRASATDTRKGGRAASGQVLGLDVLARSTAAATSALHWRQTGGLALLVLLAAESLAGRLVAGTSADDCTGISLPVAEELALGIDNLVKLLASPEKVLEGNRTHGGGNDVNVLLLGTTEQVSGGNHRRHLPDPVGKLPRVGNGSRKEDDVDVLGQHDDDLFPNDATLRVSTKISTRQPTSASLT